MAPVGVVGVGSAPVGGGVVGAVVPVGLAGSPGSAGSGVPVGVFTAGVVGVGSAGVGRALLATVVGRAGVGAEPVGRAAWVGREGASGELGASGTPPSETGSAEVTEVGSPKRPTGVMGGCAAPCPRVRHAASAPSPRHPRPTPSIIAMMVRFEGPTIGSSMRSPVPWSVGTRVTPPPCAVRVGPGAESVAPHWLQKRDPSGLGAPHVGQNIVGDANGRAAAPQRSWRSAGG